MTQPTHICLGRAGDILVVAQCLHAKGGGRLMVQRDYLPLLEGMSYIHPIPYDGSMDDISGAVLAAGGPVVVAQVASRDTEALRKHLYEPRGLAHARTDSFVKEIYDACGMIRDYKRNLPLVVDRRDAEREAELVAKHIKRGKKVIGVAVDGVTSPFPYKPLLMELLRGRFRRGYAVLDLGTVKAKRLYDMLGILERLHALVAGDSAMLHLATALPNLPVVALTQDKPSLWHGSAWRPQHVGYCRYSDFPTRAVTMLNAIDDAEAMPKDAAIVHVYPVFEGYENGIFWGGTRPLPITVGMFGRDAHNSPVKDEKRYPFLRDAVRAACMAASDSDVIVLTRQETEFMPGALERLPDEVPCYSRRITRSPHGDTWSPVIDMFAFRKAFWESVVGEMPDMILGRDQYWQSVLAALMQKHGAKEVHNAVYREVGE